MAKKKGYSAEEIAGGIAVAVVSGWILNKIFGGKTTTTAGPVDQPCPAGQARPNPLGSCLPIVCPPGQSLGAPDGKCHPTIILGTPPIGPGTPPVVIINPNPPGVFIGNCPPGQHKESPGGPCVPNVINPNLGCPDGTVEDLNGNCVPVQDFAVIRPGDVVLFIYRSDSNVPGEAFATAVSAKGASATTIRQAASDDPDQIAAQGEATTFDVAIVMPGVSNSLRKRVWKQGGVERPSVDVYPSTLQLVENAPYYIAQRAAGFDQMGYLLPQGLAEVAGITKAVDELTNPGGVPVTSAVLGSVSPGADGYVRAAELSQARSPRDLARSGGFAFPCPELPSADDDQQDRGDLLPREAEGR